MGMVFANCRHYAAQIHFAVSIIAEEIFLQPLPSFAVMWKLMMHEPGKILRRKKGEATCIIRQQKLVMEARKSETAVQSSTLFPIGCTGNKCSR